MAYDPRRRIGGAGGSAGLGGSYSASPEDLTGSWATASPEDRAAASRTRSPGLRGAGAYPGAYPGQDAGSRRLANSAVNYGAFAGIQNRLANAPPGQRERRAAYLEAIGMMPTYNGVPLSQALAGGGGPGLSSAGIVDSRGIGPARPGGAYVEDNPGTPGASAGALSALSGGVPSFAGLLGGGAFKGSGLDGGIDAAYQRLIASGGSPYSAADRTRMEQGVFDTAARATSESVEDARLSAARRGRTLGAEEEARIRQRGAAGADRARFETRTGLDRERQMALLAALSGAGASVRDRQTAEILRGQLEAQAAGVGLGGLQFAMGL